MSDAERVDARKAVEYVESLHVKSEAGQEVCEVASARRGEVRESRRVAGHDSPEMIKVV